MVNLGFGLLLFDFFGFECLLLDFRDLLRGFLDGDFNNFFGVWLWFAIEEFFGLLVAHWFYNFFNNKYGKFNNELDPLYQRKILKTKILKINLPNEQINNPNGHIKFSFHPNSRNLLHPTHLPTTSWCNDFGIGLIHFLRIFVILVWKRLKITSKKTQDSLIENRHKGKVWRLLRMVWNFLVQLKVVGVGLEGRWLCFEFLFNLWRFWLISWLDVLWLLSRDSDYRGFGWFGNHCSGSYCYWCHSIGSELNPFTDFASFHNFSRFAPNFNRHYFQGYRYSCFICISLIVACIRLCTWSFSYESICNPGAMIGKHPVICRLIPSGA